MMAGKEDVMLSLSLGSMENRFPPILQLNLMPSPSSPAPTHRNPKWSDLLAASPQGWERMRGIDVNRAPPPSSSAAVAGRESEEEEAGASSPNSTLSSVSGKRDHARLTCAAANGGGSEEQETDPSSSRGGNSDDEDGEGSRKKLRLSKDQSAVLEESFKDHNTLNPKQKLALAKQLNLRPRQVEVWFQNRRARTKLKQTEVDCEFLKRCCENLTEENRRLQKEVAELRALKLSPPLYMHMTPPTTLTMCPSCERVASTSSTAAATATTSAPPPDHRRRSFTTAAPVHWAPMPLRTASFMEIHPHRSSS